MNNLIGTADFAAFLETSPVPCLLLTPELNIVTMSESYAKVTKVEPQKVIGKYIFDVFPDNPDDKNANGVSLLHASLKRVLALKKTDAMAIQRYDIPKPASEGGGFEVRHWAPLNMPVMNQKKDVIFIIHRVEDITDSVNIKLARLGELRSHPSKTTSEDDRQRQAQKMEAMGQLAGGVAHDFNNILNIIMMTCEDVLADSSLSSASKKGVNQILKSADSAATLTRQLLAFSRRQVLQPVPTNFNKVYSSLETLYRRLLPENIELQSVLAHDLDSALVDPGQLEQIIMNLIVNARDAMPQGGKVVVETANAYVDKDLANGPMKVSEGRYAMISIRDTGTGMDSNTQARIFEPFFTTKGPGKGTGLGLATVYGIVSQNKGTVWVYSELGRGSTFKIYLPVTEALTQDKVRSSPSDDSKVAAPKHVILVVEDQAQLRELVCSDLRKKGFEVLEAENGLRALQVLKTYTAPVDLIITDVVMPEMGGQALAEEVLKSRPGTKILFLSGYTDDVLQTSGWPGASPHFLEKPFRKEALINKIYQILNSVNT